MLSRSLACILIVFSLALPRAGAQESAAGELLRRVPPEFNLVFVVQDLRGHVDRVRHEAWFKKLQDNPLARTFLASPEFRDLSKIEADLKQYLQLDLATIRDEIVGDAVVFAYQPVAPGQEGVEKGLLLVKARKADFLTQVIDKVNTLQTNAGELTALESRKHNDLTYYRRVHQRATHYYFQDGPLLAVTSNEATLHAVLDRKNAEAPLAAKHLEQSQVKRPIASLWLNPRAFDAELLKQASQKIGPEAAFLQNVQKVWADLEGVLLTLGGDPNPELQLTLLEKTNLENTRPRSPVIASDLWNRFPENALISSASQVDFALLANQLLDLVAPSDRPALREVLQKNLGAAMGVDLFRDVLPNIGPDVGFSIFPRDANPADKTGPFPHGIIAVAVKSAPQGAPVDQLLFRSTQMFAGLFIYEHNRKSKDHLIQFRSVQQGNVEVKYLIQDQFFPPGFQPAIALKDGYFLVATSPQAIAQFRAGTFPRSESAEVPLVKISPLELSKVVRERRDLLLEQMIKKGKETPETANHILDGLAAGLETFQSLQLLQRTGPRQSAWILRLVPTKE